MARRKREEKPPTSNRGRPGARGVFLIFDRQPASGEDPDADAPLARSDDEEPEAVRPVRRTAIRARR